MWRAWLGQEVFTGYWSGALKVGDRWEELQVFYQAEISNSVGGNSYLKEDNIILIHLLMKYAPGF